VSCVRMSGSACPIWPNHFPPRHGAGSRLTTFWLLTNGLSVYALQPHHQEAGRKEWMDAKASKLRLQSALWAQLSELILPGASQPSIATQAHRH
jgi:hypothetical protein